MNFLETMKDLIVYLLENGLLLLSIFGLFCSVGFIYGVYGLVVGFREFSKEYDKQN